MTLQDILNIQFTIVVGDRPISAPPPGRQVAESRLYAVARMITGGEPV